MFLVSTTQNSTGHTLRRIPTGDVMVHPDPEGLALGYISRDAKVVPTTRGEVLAVLTTDKGDCPVVRVPEGFLR